MRTDVLLVLAKAALEIGEALEKADHPSGVKQITSVEESPSFETCRVCEADAKAKPELKGTHGDVCNECEKKLPKVKKSDEDIYLAGGTCLNCGPPGVYGNGYNAKGTLPCNRCGHQPPNKMKASEVRAAIHARDAAMDAKEHRVPHGVPGLSDPSPSRKRWP